MLVSDMAGRRLRGAQGPELGFDLSGDKSHRQGDGPGSKELEAQGSPSRPSTRSFELLPATTRRRAQAALLRRSWRVIVEQREDGGVTSEVTVAL